MTRVAEYLVRAAEFEVLAAATSIDTLKKRYATSPPVTVCSPGSGNG
jgi:hypothetical protein